MWHAELIQLVVYDLLNIKWLPASSDFLSGASWKYHTIEVLVCKCCKSHSVVLVLCVCETSVSEWGQQRYSWLLGEVLASRRMGKEFLAGVVVTFHCAWVPLPLGTYNCVLSHRHPSGALSRKRERINKLLAKHKSASQSRVYVFTRLQRSACTCSLSKRTLFSLSLKDSHAGTYQTST